MEHREDVQPDNNHTVPYGIERCRMAQKKKQNQKQIQKRKENIRGAERAIIRDFCLRKKSALHI